MIKSYADKRAYLVHCGLAPTGFPADLLRRAKIRLDVLHNAAALDDLRVPPGNRLKQLAGSRAGLHSIRINDQWRICFRWAEGNAYDVEIIDYH